jgi:hypothetical protein
MHRHLPPRLSTIEAEALPSHRVMLSRWSSVLWPPPTSHPASLWISLHQLIPAITMDVDHRPNETSPVPSPTFTASRSPYAGEFFGAALSGSSRLPWPSLSLTSSALPCSPLGANLSALLPVCRTGVHFMLRAAVLLSFLRRLQRFSTSSHPEALVACYAVA